MCFFCVQNVKKRGISMLRSAASGKTCGFPRCAVLHLVKPPVLPDVRLRRMKSPIDTDAYMQA